MQLTYEIKDVCLPISKKKFVLPPPHTLRLRVLICIFFVNQYHTMKLLSLIVKCFIFVHVCHIIILRNMLCHLTWQFYYNNFKNTIWPPLIDIQGKTKWQNGKMFIGSHKLEQATGAPFNQRGHNIGDMRVFILDKYML